MTTATSAQGTAPTAIVFQAAATPPRYDIYVQIHRALRLFMTDTLGRIGWLDTGDAAETAATLDQLTELLQACRSHLEHENSHIHPAIEAAHPGLSLRIAGEHLEHEESIAALEAETASLRAAPTAPAALRLYRHLALFVADNFRHMHLEETAHNEALWSAYPDAEIIAIEQRLVATLSAEEQMLVLRWMTPALPPQGRASWFGELKQNMPPEVFAGVLGAARATLDEAAWGKLARALELPAEGAARGR